MQKQSVLQNGAGASAVVGIVAILLLLGAATYMFRINSNIPPRADQISPTAAVTTNTGVTTAPTNIDAKLNDIQLDQQGVDTSMNQPETVNVEN